MEKEYLYAKREEIIKMFERINNTNTEISGLPNSSKVSNDVIKKTLIKSKVKDIYRVK